MLGRNTLGAISALLLLYSVCAQYVLSYKRPPSTTCSDRHLRLLKLCCLRTYANITQ